MSSIPFFSVVVPLYNKAPHVARSIASVLNQTLEDFELIIVNDASTDGSVEEVQKFYDARIRLLHRDIPGPGGYAARNLGIKEARGLWLAFLDADDEWYPKHLWNMKNLARRYPEVCFMGCGWHLRTKETITENPYYKVSKKRGPHTLTTKDYIKSCVKGSIPVWTSTVCIRKDSPVAFNLFPAEKPARRGGDLHAWLKMICYHKIMAWNPVIGAAYHRDSVNMVTATALALPSLMNRETYRELALKLDGEEQKLLKSYLNIRLKNAWFVNIRRKSSNFRLFPRIYWRSHLSSLLPVVFYSLLPSFFVRLWYEVKKSPVSRRS